MSAETDLRLLFEQRMSSYPIRENMKSSIIEYLIHGRPVGGFLRAVLENNLVEAAGRADEDNRKHLFEYAGIMYNVMPMGSWRDKARVDAWIENGGIIGQEKEVAP